MRRVDFPTHPIHAPSCMDDAVVQERPQDFGWRVNALLQPEAKKSLRIWQRNGAFWSISEWICGQHSAVLYTCLPWLLSKYNINIENCSFCMFSLFNFSSIFAREGQLTPFAPMCGRPWCGLWAILRKYVAGELLNTVAMNTPPDFLIASSGR